MKAASGVVWGWGRRRGWHGDGRAVNGGHKRKNYICSVAATVLHLTLMFGGGDQFKSSIHRMKQEGGSLNNANAIKNKIHLSETSHNSLYPWWYIAVGVAVG